MELLLELPLEALVFRNSATLAGYIWTCLALFAAGIGAWHFRFIGSASRSESAHKSLIPPASPVVPHLTPTSTSIESGILPKDCGEQKESRSATKGRFRAYFPGEEGDMAGKETENMGEWVINGVYGGVECFDLFDWGWRGDLGWYNSQDRTVINGNVVRLWDGRGRPRHSGKVI